MIFSNFVITCSVLGARGGGDPNCVQDHSRSLNLYRSWGADPQECLRRSLLASPKQGPCLLYIKHNIGECVAIYPLHH